MGWVVIPWNWTHSSLVVLPQRNSSIFVFLQIELAVALANQPIVEKIAHRRSTFILDQLYCFA
jgi:hypothetical protein